MCVKVKTTRSPTQRNNSLTAHPGAGHLGEAKGEAERARASGGEHGVRVGGMDGGRDGGDVVGQEGLGRRATFAVLREVGGTGESRVSLKPRGHRYCATTLLLPLQVPGI